MEGTDTRSKHRPHEFHGDIPRHAVKLFGENVTATSRDAARRKKEAETEAKKRYQKEKELQQRESSSGGSSSILPS